jgi:hypothetical protein
MAKTIMNQLKFEIPEGYEIDLSKSDFPNVYLAFKKKELSLPKTYDALESVSGWYTTPTSETEYERTTKPNTCDINLFASVEQAKASLALAQLSQLREVYRQGWQPNWDDGKIDNWCLYFYENEFKVGLCYHHHHFLSFQSKEIAEEFLNNFKDLILEAKPLMS